MSTPCRRSRAPDQRNAGHEQLADPGGGQADHQCGHEHPPEVSARKPGHQRAQRGGGGNAQRPSGKNLRSRLRLRCVRPRSLRVRTGGRADPGDHLAGPPPFDRCGEDVDGVAEASSRPPRTSSRLRPNMSPMTPKFSSRIAVGRMNAVVTQASCDPDAWLDRTVDRGRQGDAQLCDCYRKTRGVQRSLRQFRDVACGGGCWTAFLGRRGHSGSLLALCRRRFDTSDASSPCGTQSTGGVLEGIQPAGRTGCGVPENVSRTSP